MSLSKNWKAQSISGIAGNEIIVTGQANVGVLTVLAELAKRVPQGINPKILQLDLLHAHNADPGNFQKVQYNEKISKLDQYATVEIFSNKKVIESIKVIIVK